VHCHPNTVRYRLRRLHQLTGRSLTDPRDLADLRAAALTLRLIPGTVDPDNKR
jgi:DNA-binding PucR family transcriptional regulator